MAAEKITISLPPDLKAAFMEKAKKEKRGPSNAIQMLIERWVLDDRMATSPLNPNGEGGAWPGTTTKNPT